MHLTDDGIRKAPWQLAGSQSSRVLYGLNNIRHCSISGCVPDFDNRHSFIVGELPRRTPKKSGRVPHSQLDLHGPKPTSLRKKSASLLPILALDGRLENCLSAGSWSDDGNQRHGDFHAACHGLARGDVEHRLLGVIGDAPSAYRSRESK